MGKKQLEQNSQLETEKKIKKLIKEDKDYSSLWPIFLLVGVAWLLKVAVGLPIWNFVVSFF